MTVALDKIDVDANGVLKPHSKLVCTLKCGAQIAIMTPLSPEDIMAIWNTKRQTFKIPTGDRSYAVLRKRSVAFLHTFIQEE